MPSRQVQHCLSVAGACAYVLHVVLQQLINSRLRLAGPEEQLRDADEVRGCEAGNGRDLPGVVWEQTLQQHGLVLLRRRAAQQLPVVGVDEGVVQRGETAVVQDADEGAGSEETTHRGNDTLAGGVVQCRAAPRVRGVYVGAARQQQVNDGVGVGLRRAHERRLAGAITQVDVSAVSDESLAGDAVPGPGRVLQRRARRRVGAIDVVGERQQWRHRRDVITFGDVQDETGPEVVVVDVGHCLGVVA